MPPNTALWEERARQLQRFYHQGPPLSHKSLISPQDLARASLLQPDYDVKTTDEEEDWPAKWCQSGPRGAQSLQGVLTRREWKALPTASPDKSKTNASSQHAGEAGGGEATEASATDTPAAEESQAAAVPGPESQPEMPQQQQGQGQLQAQTGTNHQARSSPGREGEAVGEQAQVADVTTSARASPGASRALSPNPTPRLESQEDAQPESRDEEQGGTSQTLGEHARVPQVPQASVAAVVPAVGLEGNSINNMGKEQSGAMAADFIKTGFQQQPAAPPPAPHVLGQRQRESALPPVSLPRAQKTPAASTMAPLPPAAVLLAAATYATASATPPATLDQSGHQGPVTTGAVTSGGAAGTLAAAVASWFPSRLKPKPTEAQASEQSSRDAAYLPQPAPVVDGEEEKAPRQREGAPLAKGVAWKNQQELQQHQDHSRQKHLGHEQYGLLGSARHTEGSGEPRQQAVAEAATSSSRVQGGDERVRAPVPKESPSWRYSQAEYEQYRRFLKRDGKKTSTQGKR